MMMQEDEHMSNKLLSTAMVTDIGPRALLGPITTVNFLTVARC